MIEKVIDTQSLDTVLNIFGNYDENVNLIQKEYNVVVLNRGTDIKITGDEENVYKACEAIKSLLLLSEKGGPINEQSIRYVFSLVKEGTQRELENLSDDGICVTTSGKIVRPKTIGQKKYVDEIKKNTIVLGVGPAGTGNGCKSFSRSRSESHNSYSACGRGGRKARFSSR